MSRSDYQTLSKLAQKIYGHIFYKYQQGVAGQGSTASAETCREWMDEAEKIADGISSKLSKKEAETKWKKRADKVVEKYVKAELKRQKELGKEQWRSQNRTYTYGYSPMPAPSWYTGPQYQAPGVTQMTNMMGGLSLNTSPTPNAAQYSYGVADRGAAASYYNPPPTPSSSSYSRADPFPTSTWGTGAWDTPVPSVRPRALSHSSVHSSGSSTVRGIPLGNGSHVASSITSSSRSGLPLERSLSQARGSVDLGPPRSHASNRSRHSSLSSTTHSTSGWPANTWTSPPPPLSQGSATVRSSSPVATIEQVLGGEDRQQTPHHSPHANRSPSVMSGGSDAYTEVPDTGGRVLRHTGRRRHSTSTRSHTSYGQNDGW
ncbi:uncharacterized protein FOMMEDRAFT_160278 [Fomitiporia mediterranea MF3/22]|uniref:uncharacterized protein n=1 Tax=Fomitiporia mediterranea (strain MF3/22) TaxID=694068 RepID=UPI00044097EF|nr:uncharacterized protein FOMMEDRAFT_160278 [Fomitiporia mediterranea MF3/22]EJC99832.1 hypothetical protein FOMMEDRAFT_160278 [Fomitiporia mediterranea MF3/22]